MSNFIPLSKPIGPLPDEAITEILAARRAIIETHEKASLEKINVLKIISKEDLLSVLDNIATFPKIKASGGIGYSSPRIEREPPLKKWYQEKLAYLESLPPNLCQGVDYSPIKKILLKWLKEEEKSEVEGRIVATGCLIVLFLPIFILLWLIISEKSSSSSGVKEKKDR